MNGDNQLSKEYYARAAQFLGWNVQKKIYNVQVKPNWLGKEDKFWYLNHTRDGKEFIIVDVVQGKRKHAFDHVRLASSLSEAASIPYDHTNLPFDTIEIQENKIKFNIGNSRWVCDTETYRCGQQGEKSEASPSELISPDGLWAAYVEDYNIYVKSLETGEKRQLTTNGELHNAYGTRAESNLFYISNMRAGKKVPPVALWSHDSRRLVTHRLDERGVEPFHLLQNAPPDGSVRPVLYTFLYPLPGDEVVPLASLVILDVEKGEQIEVDYEPQTDTRGPLPIEIKEVWWSEDSASINYIFRERGDKALRLLKVNPETGSVRVILEERGPTHVEPNLTSSFMGSLPNVRVLENGEVIWFSQKNGWGHLYLHDGETGAEKNRITDGVMVVRDLLHVDEEKRRIYVTACGGENGRDPYYRHLYRMNFDGSDLILLTPEDADHEVKFSPDGRHFVDTSSRVDSPPVTVLRDCDGKQILMLEDADLELLEVMGWKGLERFKVKACDGVTNLYGVIYKPTRFNTEEKYPIIDSIYPGPQTIRAPKSFPLTPMAASGFWEPQALAELGFIVITVDGPGTSYRSKAFQDMSYGRLGDGGGISDHIHVIRQLTATRPYMDISRVGVYGHSGGGNASTRAFLMFPDFYKVAVSSAGNHDQRGYHAGWGEKYQGMLDEDNYVNQINALLAGNLKGKLLLIHGELDDNVHPALTMQVVNALIKANKDFDMLIMPNMNHSLGNNPYFIRKKWDYFVEHLLEKQPPKGYKIEAPSL